MNYLEHLSKAMTDIKVQGTTMYHDLGGESVPCKLGTYEYADQLYTRCELCEADMLEAQEGWDDLSYNTEGWYPEESDYLMAMEQDNV